MSLELGSESDDSSDIGIMLNKAHEDKMKEVQNDEMDSDDDSDDGETSENSFDDDRKRKQRQRIGSHPRRRRRRRRRGSKKSIDLVQSSDEEDTSDNNNKTNKNNGKNENAPNVSQPLKPIVLVLSSDDEAPPSYSRTVNPTSAAANMAIASLRKSKYSNSLQHIEHEADMAAYVAAGSNRLSERSTLTINVTVQFDDKHAAEEVPKVDRLYLRGDQTVGDFEAKFLETTKLKKEKYTIGIKYKGMWLTLKKQLYKIKDIEPVSHFEVILYHSAIGQKKSSKNLGKAISVKCRNGKAVDMVKIHMKETFLALLERYCEAKNIANSAGICLEFDGETLGMNDTPENLDMEDDDMIDVKIK